MILQIPSDSMFELETLSHSILTLQAFVYGGKYMDTCHLKPVGPLVPVSPFQPAAPPPTADASLTNALNIWLIVYGGVFLGISLIVLVMRWYWIDIAYEQDYDFSTRVGRLTPLRICQAALLATFLAFCIAWVAYGGTLLFGTPGKTCKNSADSGGRLVYKVSFALWILMILGLPPLGMMLVEIWYFMGEVL